MARKNAYLVLNKGLKIGREKIEIWLYENDKNPRIGIVSISNSTVFWSKNKKSKEKKIPIQELIDYIEKFGK